MNYKDSLLMPSTSFSMRGDLPNSEIVQRNLWEEMDLYQKIQEKNKGKESFILHDGPPYANGNIHLGHAFQKILKDIINRNKILEGYNVTFIPGWDTHGLPIEQAVTNSGINRKEMSKAKFRELCHKYALEQVDKQKEDFKNLNVIADWNNPYITLNKTYEAKQIEVFAKMAEKGLIFRGLKPVYWSTSSESALAEAEIEYKDKKDPSMFVAFDIIKGNGIVDNGDKLIIWTTTPWTLPGNLAVAVGEEIEYCKVKYNEKSYIVAKELVENLTIEFNWEEYEIISTFNGKEIERIVYKHPFMDRESIVVVGYHVTTQSGTGLVHIAPSYGVDDFNIGKEYDLGMVNGVNDQGILTNESGMFAGLFYEDANKEIGKYLEENQFLIKLKFITHSYPHDWRTKKPIIFRATSQWFCSIDKIREDLLKELEENVEFHTNWGKSRIYNMIKERGDWCISRQRVWGVPIPIFYNEDGSAIVDYDIMMHVANLFREHGSNIWFEKSALELLPEGYTNSLSPNNKFTKEEDIMDVWFDSGTSFAGVLMENNLKFPADIYLEGSDQYRGWFNSSLICGVAGYEKSPYKKLLSTGFVLDGKGFKMSKSIGNIVDPMKVIKMHGADILRLWAASVDFREDVKFSDELLNQVKESYRKIRNTYRFMLGNLSDFDPNNDKVNYEDMNIYNKYMMIKISEFINEIKSSYDKYNFNDIYKNVNNYIGFTLSNFYLDFTKDILYIEKANSQIRREVQTVLYECLNALIKLLAPILPHTSEEVYKLIPGEKLESIFLDLNPTSKEYVDKEEVISLFDKFFDIKTDVYKALEEARNNKLIGKGLEASVKININDSHIIVKEKLSKYLKQLLIVSKITFVEEILTPYNYCSIEIENFNAYKCERCWNIFEEEEMQGDICKRCFDVIND